MDKSHGCAECFEVNKGYITLETGHKVCKLCQGRVLDLQEAFDYIASLEADVANLEEQLYYEY